MSSSNLSRRKFLATQAAGALATSIAPTVGKRAVAKATAVAPVWLYVTSERCLDNEWVPSGLYLSRADVRQYGLAQMKISRVRFEQLNSERRFRVACAEWGPLEAGLNKACPESERDAALDAALESYPEIPSNTLDVPGNLELSEEFAADMSTRAEGLAEVARLNRAACEAGLSNARGCIFKPWYVLLEMGKTVTLPTGTYETDPSSGIGIESTYTQRPFRVVRPTEAEREGQSGGGVA